MKDPKKQDSEEEVDVEESYEDNLDPHDIIPLHKPTNRSHVTELARDMRERGWRGRELLVIRRGEQYLAWTGSHRIEAARRAKLASVPCHVVQEPRILKFGVTAQEVHVMDYERLEICKKLGDERATELMSLEGRIL